MATRDRTSEYSERVCVQCTGTWRTRRKDAKLCSPTCRSAWYKAQKIQPPDPGPKPRLCRLPVDHPVRVEMRRAAAARHTFSAARTQSPLRQAFEAGDHRAIIRALRAHSIESPRGCWLWQRRIKDGYPVVRIAGRQLGAHRVALEARLQRPLGAQPAHHVCAVSQCVNPDHLEPVSTRVNTIEAMARTYLLRRISQLEQALGEVDATNPLLLEVGVHAP